MDMREALAEALMQYEGALIVVAHDRHLLQATTDQWMLVADGKVARFEGTLDDYKQWAREFHARGSKREERVDFVSRKDERRAQAAARQREAAARKPFEKRLAAIEKELAALAEESQGNEAFLAGAEAYEDANREKLQATLKRRGEVAERVAVLEHDWLWIQAEMEKGPVDPV
jgi:ATP-binding cassette subfamily F protein 3